MTKQVAAALDEIGLRATFEVIPVEQYIQRSFAPPGSAEHPQAFSYTWFSGYPGASEYLGQYRCGAGFNVTGYCERAIDRRFDEAKSLETSDPGSANRAWSEIEHDLVDAAPLVPVLNPISTFVVSERSGNVQINPGLGVLLSQIWVR